MKSHIKHLIVLFILLLGVSEIQAQYGYGGGGYGYGGYGGRGMYGRGRTAIPQAGPSTPKAPEPKTAAEIVDGEMPAIAETLGLDEFEKAVLSTTLKKYVQERIELQILKLPADKMREAYEKITVRQDEELKAGLPLEKYEAFVQMQKDGVAKMQKEMKKEEKRRNKKKKKKKSKE
ncbi:hypothetical protein FEE95_10960 [Maribacter algarum]|uniref:LTXXQ motif family protein n=1 Tax=Maribacter algarum (ex Zhang et al. 2020) TaxID=2578118 RepID=A0A5S3PQN4_9FLAO|nr:hypothetical protein [Maribacter algarum]TMM57004.1 hypothetical protein FEE95_10960 [Maribacter algarum]